jgi:hypothetical protein
MKRDLQSDAAACPARTLSVAEEAQAPVGIDDDGILVLVEFFKTLDQWDRDAENLRKVV